MHKRLSLLAFLVMVVATGCTTRSLGYYGDEKAGNNCKAEVVARLKNPSSAHFGAPHSSSASEDFGNHRLLFMNMSFRDGGRVYFADAVCALKSEVGSFTDVDTSFNQTVGGEGFINGVYIKLEK